MFSYIPLTKGRVTIIDSEDYKLLSQFKWMFHCGYVRRVNKGKTIHMHRFLLKCPDNLEVDHINRNKLDNRKSNLRIVSRQQNMFNKERYKGSSSRYKGVSWHSKDKIWNAQIRVNKKIHYLGAYKKEETAAAAYNYFALKYFGEYAVLNDVDSINFREHRFLKKESTSKYRGVTYRRSCGKWVSRITVNGRRLSLGYFDTEIEAAVAYNNAFKKYKIGKEVPNAI